MEEMQQTQQGQEAYVQGPDLKKERKFCSGMGMSFFVFLATVSVVQILVGTLLQMFCIELVALYPGIYMMLVMLPIYVVGYPLLCALTKRKEAVSLSEHKLGAGKFMIVLMMCYSVMLVGGILGNIVNLIIGFIKGSPVVNSLDGLLNGNSVWVNVFIVGICAPIFEELMFRKVLVDRMLRYGEAAAVVVSGLMFGLFHGNFSQFFFAAALGWMFAFVYVKTGRIRYPIILHMIINLGSSLLLPVLQMLDMDRLASLEEMSKQMMAGAASEGMMADYFQVIGEIMIPLIILILYEIWVYGMAIAGIVLLIMRRKQFTFSKGPVTLPKGKRASVIWGNAGMILFTLGCGALFVMVLAA